MKEEILDKRSAVLKATLELISEQGFHGTPMSQIAQRANIGVGTIYRYFSSKEDLINGLYIDIKTRMTRYVFRDYSENISVSVGLKQLLSNVIHYFIENPMELSFIEQYENSPLITDATREMSMHAAEPLKALFKRAMEQNILKELPFDMLGALFSGAVISLAKLYLSGTAGFDEIYLNAGVDAIWDMIKR